MENIGEKTECILEVNAFSKEESDQSNYFHSPDYAPENSNPENSTELLFNENSMFVPASEYHKVMFGDNLSKVGFYAKYIHGRHQIPYIRMPRKGKGGRGNEYVLLVDDPEIQKKIITQKELKEKVGQRKKAFLVNIPQKMSGEFQNVMTFSYREFINFLRLEKNREKILAERNKKRRVTIPQEHYDLLVEYSRELNVKVCDVFPILLNHFIKYKVGGNNNG